MTTSSVSAFANIARLAGLLLLILVAREVAISKVSIGEQPLLIAALVGGIGAVIAGLTMSRRIIAREDSQTRGLTSRGAT